MGQTEVVVKALKNAGYEIRKRDDGNAGTVTRLAVPDPGPRSRENPMLIVDATAA